MIHQTLSIGGVDWLPPPPPPPPLFPIEIHSGQFTGRVHPPNQFVPEIVSPLRFSPSLIRHTLLIGFFFSKNLFLPLAPSTNATPAFSTL